MMAQFNSYTEFTTYSRNIKVYIFWKQKEKESESAKKKFLRQQKLLGITLVAISIIGCAIIPEDCGGCLVAGLMGIARVIYD